MLISSKSLTFFRPKKGNPEWPKSHQTLLPLSLVLLISVTNTACVRVEILI